MPEIIFKGRQYNLIEKRVAFGAENERYYQIAERNGEMFFFKHWINHVVHCGLIEISYNIKLSHPYIAPLLDFELSKDFKDLSLMFHYYPYKTLMEYNEISNEDYNTICTQLDEIAEYFKQKNIITDKEDTQELHYYEKLYHVIIKNELKIIWDWGLPNMIWNTDERQIILIDLGRHDQAWPYIYNYWGKWLKDLNENYKHNHTHC